MNYINQIRGFWTSHEEHSFSTTEIALYFHLLEVCNICQWKNPFKRNNQRIQADLGLSFNTLKNARNKLKTCGLIGVSTQNGSPNTTYTLSNFDEVFTRFERGSHEVTTEVLPTKDKQNKTKLNNNNYCESENDLKLMFDEFRKSYKGTKGGLDVEFKNLQKKRAEDWREIIPLLAPALNEMVEWRAKAQEAGMFVPEWPMLKTWINQSRWEIEFESIKQIENGSRKDRSNSKENESGAPNYNEVF